MGSATLPKCCHYLSQPVLLRACSGLVTADQLWLACSQGTHRLVGKEIAWMGQMSISYTQDFDSLCSLTFYNLTKYKY